MIRKLLKKKNERPLGSWVWCKYCRWQSMYPLTRPVGFFCEIKGHEEEFNPITGEMQTKVADRYYLEEAKSNDICNPKLVLLGRIRRFLGLPIGNDNE